MTSHALPAPTLFALTSFVQSLDEGLQAEAHKVAQAIAVDPAFDHAYIGSSLTRALICSIAHSLDVAALRVDELSNGGCEVVSVHAPIERRFRLKLAKRDRYGFLDVKTSSDSLLAGKAREATLSLFDEPEPVPNACEQWVLAYVLNPATRTFGEVCAALIVGFMNDHAPFRLKLDNVVHIPLVAPPPPTFRGEEDDLDLGDDDDKRGEVAS